MKSKFDSLEDLISELEITEDIINVDKIRRELLRKLSQVHPDHNSGEFRDEKQKEKYFKIRDAINFIDNSENSSKSLIPIGQLTEIIKIIAQTGQLNKRVSDKESNIFSKTSLNIKRKYLLPKLSTGILIAILGLLLSFSNSFQNHPLYRALKDNVFFTNGEIRLAKLNKSAVYLNSILEKNYYKLSGLIMESGYDIKLPTFQRIDIFFDKELTKKIEKILSNKNELAYTIESIERKIQRVSKTPASNTEKKVTLKLKHELEYLYSYLSQISEDYRNLILAKGKLDYDETQINKFLLNIILILFLIFLFLFIITWIREHSDHRWLAYLSTETGIIECFKKIVQEFGKIRRNNLRFTSSEFAEITSLKPTPLFLRPILGKKLNQNDMYDLSKIIIDKLIERKLILKIDETDIHEWYQISETVAKKYL